MKNIPLIALAAASVVSAGGCKSANTAKENVEPVPEATAPVVIGGGTSQGQTPAQFMPKALVYRTNGNYDDKVPVSLSADGKSLISYPAPSDVSEVLSTPVSLQDGWLLDRRGIGPNTAFLKYTYKEYSEQKETPSQAQLLENIIPGARVTEAYQLPVNASEAIANPSVCRQYITDGFKNCRRL